MHTRTQLKRLPLRWWSGQPWQPALLVAALLLLLLSHPLIHGDGIAYFMYLDSIAGDGDLDLHNQVQRFSRATIYHYFYSPLTGEPVTSFPFGSAFLVAPFYWLAQWLEPLVPGLRAHPEHFATRQGLPLAYSLMATLAALIYTLAAVWLAYQVAQRVASRRAAALAAVACLAGTPLLFYATIEPMASHAYGTFVLALALWFATRAAPPPAAAPAIAYSLPLPRALLLGLLLGMSALIRWQLLLFALPVGLALVGRALLPPLRPRPAANVAAFGLGVGLFVGLCALYFWRFFGAPLFIPNEAQLEQSFLGLPLRYLLPFLFDLNNGWLVWAPVAVLGLAGLLWLSLAVPGVWRIVALVCLAGIALEIALNASIHDWRAGWSFGQRRMTEAYPALVLGVAWLLSRAPWRKVLAGVVLLCALYGLLLLVAYLYYTHTTPHPEGASNIVVIGWLLHSPNAPPLWQIVQERYGPWSWSKPQL